MRAQPVRHYDSPPLPSVELSSTRKPVPNASDKPRHWAGWVVCVIAVPHTTALDPGGLQGDPQFAGCLRSQATTPPVANLESTLIPAGIAAIRRSNPAPDVSDNTRLWEVWEAWVLAPDNVHRLGELVGMCELNAKMCAQRVRQLPTMENLGDLRRCDPSRSPCSRQAHMQRPVHPACQFIQTELSKNNTCGSFTGNRPTYPEKFAWVNGGSWMDGSIPSTTCQEPRLSRSGIGPDRQSITDPTRIPHPLMHAPLN